MKRTAIILAGGKGTRLKPYTVVLPKPLMPIGEYPILEVIIRQLSAMNFERIILAVNHQADLIKTYFGDGSKWGLEIDYSLENKPLGTMGPLKSINNLPDNFLVMNGDVLTDLNFNQFYNDHCKNQDLFTISTYTRKVKIDYGVLESVNNKLTNFIEKPEYFFKVSMGIYMLSKNIIDYIPENQHYGFDDLMLKLLIEKNPATINEFKGYWLDIGRPDDYMKAIDEFEKMKEKFIL